MKPRPQAELALHILVVVVVVVDVHMAVLAVGGDDDSVAAEDGSKLVAGEGVKAMAVVCRHGEVEAAASILVEEMGSDKAEEVRYRCRVVAAVEVGTVGNILEGLKLANAVAVEN